MFRRATQLLCFNGEAMKGAVHTLRVAQSSFNAKFSSKYVLIVLPCPKPFTVFPKLSFFKLQFWLGVSEKTILYSASKQMLFYDPSPKKFFA
jgi:hypothetical protein